MFGTVLVKLADLRPSPPVKSLGRGKKLHSAAIAGLRPRLRGSHVVRPHIAVGITVPIWGSVSVHCPAGAPVQAFGSKVGVGFKLYALTVPPPVQAPDVGSKMPLEQSLNFRIPARSAAVGTNR